MPNPHPSNGIYDLGYLRVLPCQPEPWDEDKALDQTLSPKGFLILPWV